MEKGIIAIAAAIAISVVGALSAMGISRAASRAFESMAKQPEAAGRIQTSLITAIVFIETCVIYALVIALLLIFVF
ncbi:MAG TPA: ATP synthase F0 subunit C [Clostridiaceae bacterium]|nr:ATP synthase F0 subunit C [Clostridiaceae bacterium]